MHRYSFLDDYSEGCHPEILTRLTQTNLEQQAAYGQDLHSNHAKQLIGERLDSASAQIYFVTGGTQANLISIAAALRPHEAVISAASGHIANREAGAIEATGHKIICVASDDGKLTPPQIETAIAQHHAAPHMVKPAMVYLSNATEFGTCYRLAELEAIKACCEKHNLLLFVDGARLAVALAADCNDLSLAALARLADIFTLGATKNGALLGEAVVVSHAEIGGEFAFHIKQRGAMLAKGKLLGVQFEVLFEEQLYFELAARANRLAAKLSDALVAAGHRLFQATETNQVFAILPDSLIIQLQQEFDFYIWQKQDETHSLVRMVTSWATDEALVERLIARL